MGGGDLNSKKSWHPNTMKNQENVRKAEQMAANEKKRIKELQQQYDEERDREVLNKKIKSNSGITDDNRLHWMYDKPDKTVQQEDYLLGKAIDKNSDPNKLDEDVIPAVARRVVGSSMLTSSDDTQVDLARKIREDPLLLVKERERAARAALLNNPLHRKKLAELLRKEQVQVKDSKSKNKSKKKDKDLDNMLAAKLSAISGGKGIDLKSLLDSDDSSDSSTEDSKTKKKKKKDKKKKQKKNSKCSDSEENVGHKSYQSKPKEDHSKSKHKNVSPEKEHRKRRSDTASSEYESKRRGNREDYKSSTERHQAEFRRRDYNDDARHRKDSYHRRQFAQRERSPDDREKCKEQERAARLAEMVAAGAEREYERGRRVAQERERDTVAQSAPSSSARVSFTEARALPDTLENRIHSNRQYIQRDRRHMNEHFARR